ncbi:MAG TPA: diaminopimelate decarboxylase [Caballeronia sp.]|nr:diaminopimelate decarboxylase [Caballeronia sp.]
MKDAQIGGVPVRELAQTYGTPLHLIDIDEFELEADRFRRAFESRGITVGYAAKAFFCIALAELIAATTLRIDVCSMGELLTAERGGMPAGRLYFHGCGKSAEELGAIVEGRVAFSVVDSSEELERLARLAHGHSVDIMLRINPGIEVHTHEYMRTGGENTKFGIPLDTIDAIFARISELPQLRLIGLHSHLGSSITDAAPYAANVAVLLGLAERARAAGHPVAELIAGGGMAVEMVPGDPRPIDLDTLAEGLAQTVMGAPYRLAIEPGRALIARSGSALYRVMAIKQQGRRRFVIIDGGMADNPRPALYGALHQLDVLDSEAKAPPQAATLCGRSCENDVLGEVLVPDDLRAGDLVALRTTGAYTYSMASNYNRFGRPPVVFLRDGSHRRVIRGERADDVLRNDLG